MNTEEARQVYQIRRLSRWSGKMNVMAMNLTPAQFKALLVWDRGGKRLSIQDILPDHTPQEREFFVTGLSPEEQEQMQ